MTRGLVWERDGGEWPHREASRFVRAEGLRWHVQTMGQGPVLLLLHGTGASTHSWRAIAPLLARHFTVVAPDLPGHGFTSVLAYDRLSLPGMARSFGKLMEALEISPALVMGHSAGAAILIRMCLDGRIAPGGLVSLNGALFPFDGLAGQFFPPMAKVLFLNPLAPRVFAWSAGDRSRVERLIRETGSRLDADGVDFYQRLFRTPRHVAGALAMMAHWDLKPLADGFPRLEVPVLLVHGVEDKAVPPETADRVGEHLPTAEIVSLEGLGHLAHEERPDIVEGVVTRFARDVGVLAEPSGRPRRRR